MCDVNERWIERQQADERLEKVIDRVKNLNPTEYMKWLEKFTKKWGSFEIDDWDEDKSDIAYEDYMNVQMLDVFYRVIQKYANDNYIPCDGRFRGLNTYYIKYNGEYYRIVCNTKGTFYSYSWEVKYLNYDNAIPFEDIINPSKSTVERTEKIQKSVSEINELFYKLVENGVPITIIEKETKKILQNLKLIK